MKQNKSKKMKIKTINRKKAIIKVAKRIGVELGFQGLSKNVLPYDKLARN